MAQKQLEAFHHLLAGRQIPLFMHPASKPLIKVWATNVQFIISGHRPDG
jgi:hypothetical protein